jgi:hypothetical protein
VSTSAFGDGQQFGSAAGRVGTIRASLMSARTVHTPKKQPKGGGPNFKDLESQAEGAGRQLGLHAGVPIRGHDTTAIPGPSIRIGEPPNSLSVIRELIFGKS